MLCLALSQVHCVSLEMKVMQILQYKIDSGIFSFVQQEVDRKLDHHSSFTSSKEAVYTQ